MAEGALVEHVQMPQMPKALLSEEALRAITSLQGQLKRTHWKLRAAEEAAEKALDDAEERGAQMDAKYDRQQEVERSLKRLQEERDEDVKHEERLMKHLTELQEELLETKTRMERQIPQEEIEALRGELQGMRMRLVEAEKEEQELRVQVAQAEEARRKRARRPPSESEGVRQPAGQERGSRMIEARHRSARAVSEQKERDSKLQAERTTQLMRQKERLEAEWHLLCTQNSDLELHLEDVRGRNRKLEAVRTRRREANEEQEAALHEELRRHTRQIQVLRSLLDGDGVLDGSMGISGSHRNNFVLDAVEAPSFTSTAYGHLPDGSEYAHVHQPADATEMVSRDRGVGASASGSSSGSWARTLAAAPAPVADDEGRVSASICLWGGSMRPTPGMHVQSGSSKEQQAIGTLIVEQDPASWEQACTSPEDRRLAQYLYSTSGQAEELSMQDATSQEGILQRAKHGLAHLMHLDHRQEETMDQCMERWDSANSRTQGLLGEVKDWQHELGNSPHNSNISDSFALNKVDDL